MNKVITVRITEDLKKDIKELKKLDNRSISEIIRDSLRNYLLLKKFKNLRKQVIPYAEKSGLFTDEDIFELNK